MENDKLIRQRDAIDALMSYTWHDEDDAMIDDADKKRAFIEGWFPDIPAVDAVEEKQGFWKVAGTGHPKPGNQRYRKQDQWTVYKCSNCGASNGRNHSDPYCRHCGAKMLVDNCRYCYNDGQRREEEHNAAD